VTLTFDLYTSNLLPQLLLFSAMFHKIRRFYSFPFRENRKHGTDGRTDGRTDALVQCFMWPPRECRIITVSVEVTDQRIIVIVDDNCEPLNNCKFRHHTLGWRDECNKKAVLSQGIRAMPL